MGVQNVKRAYNEEGRKGLGVIIQDILTLERYINVLFTSTYGALINIRVAFNYMNMRLMKKIITTMIRPKLEYAAVVWLPQMLDIRKTECKL